MHLHNNPDIESRINLQKCTKAVMAAIIWQGDIDIGMEDAAYLAEQLFDKIYYEEGNH